MKKRRCFTQAIARAAPWRQRRRSHEDVRCVALDAQQPDSQPAGFLGQRRTEAVADRALAGANDFGGTLINESISTAAGAGYGQLMKPSEFRSLIRQMSRIPAERSTTYQKVRVFETEDQPPRSARRDQRPVAALRLLSKS